MFYVFGYDRKAVEGKRTFCVIEEKYKTIEEAKQAYCNYINDDNKSFDLIALASDPKKPNDKLIILESWDKDKQ